MNLCFDLFFTFARIGVCTFGGGYAMLPILQREVVEKRGWCTDQELADYYAIGQCTPGVLAVNLSTFIGARQKGIPGGIAAVLGVVSPSLIIITLIAALLKNFAHIPAVIHAFNGIRAAVTALVASSVVKLAKAALVRPAAVVIYLTVLILAAWAGWSPVILVILAGLAGLICRAMEGGLRK